MTTNPVRLDRLMLGMSELIASRAPGGSSVVWSPSKHPESDLSDPHFVLSLVAGPSPWGGLTRASVFQRALPLEFTVIVDAALTVGTTVIFNVSGRRFRENVIGGDTAETVRDRLLVQLAVPLIDATFVASGTDTIVVTGLAYGDLYGVEVSGPASIVTHVSSMCKIQFDSVRSEVEVQAYSRNRHPMDGASVALSRITQALELPAQQAIADCYDLSITPGAVVDLTTLTGLEWESRSAITFSVYQPSVSAQAVDTIQTAALSIEARSLPGTEAISVETNS